MKLKMVGAVAVAGLLLSVGVPQAAAQTTEGWRFYKTGDMAVTPMSPGVSVCAGTCFKTALFALGTDFDYHFRGPMAIGGLFNLGFTGGLFALQFGPQFKYKFRIGSTPHVPYLRFGLPFTVATGSGQTGFSMGIFQFGGGYRFFVHRMVGVGVDIAMAPTVVLHPTSEFNFLVNILFGVEIKI